MLEKLAQYFEHIPSAHRTFFLVGGICFFWLVESAQPLFTFRYNKIRHAGVNFLFTFTTLIVNLAFAFLIVKKSYFTNQSNFGLLHLIKMPLCATLILGLLLMDLLSAYLIHWIEHKVKWMWKFHMIHHADTYVDTTTANRHHPGESVFRAVFTTLAVLICGAPIWVVMLYQSLSALFSQFNHVNFQFPSWLDKAISWVIISPNMHKVHHHYTRPQTDSNYGNIFSIWDRIFGTYNYTPVKDLKYGLDVLDDTTSSNVKYQLKMPFDKGVKTDY